VSIGQAPWQVEVEAGGIACGGEIIDLDHVLTAAHCTFAATSERIPADDFLVIAGTGDYESRETEGQAVEVSEVRVHPYYTYVPNSQHVIPDDVAMLTLAHPFTGGSSVQPVGLVAPGAYPGEGTPVELTGFGLQNPNEKEADGELYGLGMSVGSQGECGSEKGADNAVLLCASSPVGTPCHGDSGSALTVSGPVAELVGVMDDGELIGRLSCVMDAVGTFANVAAPEIQDFIEGSESPPMAPRGGGASCAAGSAVVGATMSCQPGSWSNGPSFTYTFVNDATGQVLQSGASPTYQFSTGAVGGEVFMRLQATNAGGTGVDQTSPTAVVAAAVAKTAGPAATAAAATGHISLAATRLRVHGRTVSVRLSCAGGATCWGRLTLTVLERYLRHGRRHRRTVTIGLATFAIAHSHRLWVQMALNGTGNKLLRARHGRLGAHLAIAKLSPSPRQTQTTAVELLVAKPSRRAH
jgi:Trypsin